MNKEHPITPPPELVEDWIELAKPLPQRPPNPGELATLAARWGADQELEACCNYFEDHLRYGIAKDLRAARRPKPPSLKEQALAALAAADGADHPVVCTVITADQHAIIRRALEQLDD